MTLYNSIQNDSRSLTFKNIISGPVNPSSFGLGCKAHRPLVSFFMQTEINFDVEVWKDVPGYEGLYQVSSLGKFRSYDSLKIAFGKGYYTQKGRILKQSKEKNGYLRIALFKDLVNIKYRAHRIVAEVFVPNPEHKDQVNHINGIKTDNRAVNVEWVTASENQIHAVTTGLRPIGEDIYCAKVTENQVLIFREEYASGLSVPEIFRKHNVSRHLVNRIVKNKSWKHLL